MGVGRDVFSLANNFIEHAQLFQQFFVYGSLEFCVLDCSIARAPIRV